MYSHSSRFTVISCWIGTSSLGTPAGIQQCTDRLIRRVTKDGHYFLMSYKNTCTYTVRIMYTYTHVVEICACNTHMYVKYRNMQAKMIGCYPQLFDDSIWAWANTVDVLP